MTIHLQVERRRESVIDTEVEANSVPILTGGPFAAIVGDIIVYTTFADHEFEKS